MFALMKQSSVGTDTHRQLTVTYRPTGALKPDPRNARTHPKRQIDQLAQSIRQFGFTNPVLIDESTFLLPAMGASGQPRSSASRRCRR